LRSENRKHETTPPPTLKGKRASAPLPLRRSPLPLARVQTSSSSRKDFRVKTNNHGRMARDGKGFFKVLPRPVMFYPSMPCWRATPETALQPFQGWPACRAGGLGPFSTPLDIPCHTPIYSYANNSTLDRKLLYLGLNQINYMPFILIIMFT
jgi:hypothetical protein